MHPTKFISSTSLTKKILGPTLSRGCQCLEGKKGSQVHQKYGDIQRKRTPETQWKSDNILIKF